MRIPTIVAATIFAASPLPFQATAQTQSTGEISTDGEAFEFRWSASASASNKDQVQRLLDKATAHCSEMADRGIEGFSSRHAFREACTRMIEREVLAQLAQRSQTKEKGARLARRPSSK